MERASGNEWWRHRLYDSEGVEEINEITRRFWSEIKIEIPEVLYISVIGSTVKGYANADSDIDAYLVYELKDPSKERDVKVRIHHFVKDFEKRTGQKMSIFLDNSDGITDPKFNYIFAKDLIKPTLGDGDSYRKIIMNSLKGLGKEDLEEWIDYTVDAAAYEHSAVKAIERGIVKPEDEKEYLEARRKLISEKVRRMYVNKNDEN